MLTKELLNARTWVAKHAREILSRVEKYPNNRAIMIEMGYGPSGLPHIGTVTELVRSMMVAKVLRELQGKPVIVIGFCDDMDGMRKVPQNVPNQDMLLKYLGRPLSVVPDPFMEYTSFAEHNIRQFCRLVEEFGYKAREYRPNRENKYSLNDIIDLSCSEDSVVIVRASQMYNSGSFNPWIIKVLECYQSILDVLLPTLGDERKKTYSPIMPISPKSGKVLESGVIATYPERGTVLLTEDGCESEVSVLDGSCKLQWKVDFGMRWAMLGIDYELSGKDIGIGTNPIARQICKIMGAEPPITPMYEMFLAEDGTKISKTKGNGISLEDLLKYSSPHVLRHMMFLNPSTAKRLDMQKIPSYIDSFIKDIEKFNNTPDVENPIYYSEPAPLPNLKLTPSSILSLIQSMNINDLPLLQKHIGTALPGLTDLDKTLINSMYYFYQDHYSPPLFAPLSKELKEYLLEFLPHLSEDASLMQTKLYDLGNIAVQNGAIENLKMWFRSLYRSVLGRDEGPRLGSFFALCGIENSRRLIVDACNR